MPEYEESQWYSPADPTPRHQCPCCDYISLPERGTWQICAICYWEDDLTDLDRLDEPSGPNRGITLRQARANFAQFGAYDRAVLKDVLSEAERKHYVRKPRPVV